MNRDLQIELRRRASDIAVPKIDRIVMLAATERKVSEYDSVGLAKELSQALQWITKDIGLRNISEEDRRYMVIRTGELLKRYYGWMTLRDFRLAFELTLTGELDEYLPKGKDGQPERGHFQNFSAEYICRILNAYKQRRRGVLAKVEQPQPVALLDSGQKKRLEAKARQNLLDAYRHYCDTGQVQITRIQEVVFYGILSDNGLAAPVEVTEEERREVVERAALELLMKGASYNEISRYKQDGQKIERQAYYSARRKAIEQTFAELKDNGTRLEEFIRNEG